MALDSTYPTDIVDRVKAPEPATIEHCDRCGHAALVVWRKSGKVLAFCGHHGHDSALGLMAAGWAAQRLG